MIPDKLIFLPGASGNIQFWKPASNLVKHSGEKIHLGWPGFGATPADPIVQNFNDLVAMVINEVDRPCALIAQSMGGVIAVLAALAKPELVSHLVLAATSGGIDMSPYGAIDWRSSFVNGNPSLPCWFSDCQEDLTLKLPTVKIPTLLLWGDADPFSPVAVGQQLANLLPSARLCVFSGGNHDVANTFFSEIAALIENHLKS